MENIKKAIKHFECMKSDAVAVLDSGFGTKPNESNTVYKNRKLYAELAINALEKQMPKKPTYKHQIGVSATGKIYKGKCCECGHEQKQKGWVTQTFCDNCGQALDWSDIDEKD